MNNERIIFVVEVKDEGTGLTAMFVPTIFEHEAEEMHITQRERIILFSCAWNFCRIAMESIETYTQQIKYEGETDDVGFLRTILDSNIVNYGSPDIEDVVRWFPKCRELAFRHNLIWNDRFQAWIDSAGRAYNEVTREEKATNQTN